MNGKEKVRRGRVLTPLATVGFTMMGALLASTLLPLATVKIGVVLLGVCGGVAVLGELLLRKKGGRISLQFAAVLCLAAAAAFWMAGRERTERLAVQQFDGQQAVVSGTVSEVVQYSGGCRFLIRNGTIVTEDGETGYADVLFYTDGEPSYYGGEQTQLRTTLSAEVTLSQIGYGAQLVSSRAVYLGDTGHTVWYKVNRLRTRLLERLCRRVRAGMQSENADLLIGMMTGSREQISDSAYALLQGAGLAHLLAVSGLHIALFFAGVQRLLEKLGRRISLLAAIPVTAGYVWLTGGSISSRRAFWMILLLTLGELLRLPRNTGNALGFAVSIFCITRPMCVLQLGTLMSILSVWCMYAVVPALADGKKGSRLRPLLQGGLASVCISVVTAPVMMLMVGYIPLLAPVCSMLVLPIMPVVLVMGLLSCVGGSIGRVIGAGSDLLISWIRLVARIGNAGPQIPLGGELVRVCAGAVGVLLAVSVVLFGFYRVSVHRKLFASLAAVMIAVSGLCGVLSAREEEIKILCVADTLIFRKGKQAVAIGSGKNDSAGRTIASFLRANGVTELTLLVPEQRMQFTGGGYQLLMRFPAEAVWEAETENGDTRLENAAENLGAERSVLYSPSEWLLFGAWKMTVRPGKNGVYLLLESGGRRLVLQDRNDPEIFSGDEILYYDDPSQFAEEYGIITEETAGEMPAWEAGFLQEEWEVRVE